MEDCKKYQNVEEKNESFIKKLRKHNIINIVLLISIYLISVYIGIIKLMDDNILRISTFIDFIGVVLVILLLGVSYLAIILYSFRSTKENITIEDIVCDLVDKNIFSINEDKNKVLIKTLVTNLNNQIKVSIKHKDYNKKIKEFFNKDYTVIEEKMCKSTEIKIIFNKDKMAQYRNDDKISNLDLLQYFSSIKNLNKFKSGLKADMKSEIYQDQLKQSVDLEKFYEGIIWKIGGIFITAAFTIISLSLRLEEINSSLGFLMGTMIFFIFYKIFMRFRTSLRLYRNASRIYEKIIGVPTIKYVYDYEFEKYGLSPRIREILLTIMFLLVNATVYLWLFV